MARVHLGRPPGPGRADFASLDELAATLLAFDRRYGAIATRSSGDAPGSTCTASWPP